MSSITRAELLPVLNEMAAAMERVTRQAAERIKQLEARIAELESGPWLMAQPHKSGAVYPRGSFVEHHGSLYRALVDTQRPPVAGGDDWTQLASVRIRYTPT